MNQRLSYVRNVGMSKSFCKVGDGGRGGGGGRGGELRRDKVQNRLNTF